MSAEQTSARLALAAAPRALRVCAGDEEELRRRWKEQARSAAFEQGRAAGVEEARAELGGALDRLIGELEALHDSALSRLSSDAAGLAVEIARELLRGEIRAQRHDIERIVRETLAASGAGRGACVVHLNPRDAERLERVHFRARTQIEPDPSVSEGDVHVTTPQGLLVRDLEHALDTLSERLRQELLA